MQTPSKLNIMPFFWGGVPGTPLCDQAKPVSGLDRLKKKKALASRAEGFNPGAESRHLQVFL